jgi:hypothetical protein
MRSKMFFIVLMAFTASANSDDNRDGNWWNALQKGQKLAYTIGFLDGQTYAHIMFTAALLQGIGDPKTRKFDQTRANVAKDIERFATDDINKDLSNVTAGQLAAGLDKVYADYRNMRIDVTDTMLVVIRSIGGMSDDDVAKSLQNKRKKAGE